MTTFMFMVECQTEGCAKEGKLINGIKVTDGVEAFMHCWGQGSEDPQDYCGHCGKLGVLLDPEVYSEEEDGYEEARSSPDLGGRDVDDQDGGGQG